MQGTHLFRLVVRRLSHWSQFRRSKEKKKEDSKKGDPCNFLRLFTDKPPQPMVLPQYQGPSVDSIKVESELFEGMKFSE